MDFCKTTQAAKRLGVPYWRLSYLIRCGKISPPRKDSSGDYVWSAEDLETARSEMAARLRRVPHT